MLRLSIHLALSGKGANEPAGPMMLPKPGPTFEIDVTAPESAVMGSRPTSERATATSEKDMA